jgi:hypothetical protein
MAIVKFAPWPLLSLQCCTMAIVKFAPQPLLSLQCCTMDIVKFAPRLLLSLHHGPLLSLQSAVLNWICKGLMIVIVGCGFSGLQFEDFFFFLEKIPIILGT